MACGPRVAAADALAWRPEPSWAVQRQFWRLIATSINSAEAALKVGVSVPVGSRWFRHAGGMPPISLAEPAGRYLSFEERKEIALLRATQECVRSRIGRDPGTISRELRRNAATRGGKPEYRAFVAQWKAQQTAKRPKMATLATNDRLREYVQESLAGNVRRPDGSVVVGPEPPAWKGLNKPHRQDRRWTMAWSPEQISHRPPRGGRRPRRPRALGGRSDHRHRPVRDRHDRRTQEPLHSACASAAIRRLRPDTASQEQSRAQRLRRHRDECRAHRDDDHAP